MLKAYEYARKTKDADREPEAFVAIAYEYYSASLEQRTKYGAGIGKSQKIGAT